MPVITYNRLVKFKNLVEAWERENGRAENAERGTGRGITLIRIRLQRDTCTNKLIDAMIKKIEEEIAV